MFQKKQQKKQHLFLFFKETVKFQSAPVKPLDFPYFSLHNNMGQKSGRSSFQAEKRGVMYENLC